MGMVLLLAQLVAPPVQRGPVRLPGPEAGEQRPAPDRPAPPIELTPGPAPVPGPEPGPVQPQPPPGGPTEPGAGAALPPIQGTTPYSAAQLRRILAPCLTIAEPAERLRSCAAVLTARLVADGYLNSRVYVVATPSPGGLDVVEGRVVELRVSGSDERLNRRIKRLTGSLQGQVLHVPSVERQLELLRRLPGVALVRGNLSRLGSDPSQAVLSITVDPGRQPWQGDLSLRNDGSSGSGEGRAVATLVKPSLGVPGDTLLLYGELNVSKAPELGAVITSASYTLPLGEAWSLTGAFGYSRRNLVELPEPANGFSTSQYQGLGQLEWVFSETLSQRWSLFAGYSGSRSNTYLNDAPLPDALPSVLRSPSSGYLRIGVGGNGLGTTYGWSGNAYLLQGIGAATPDTQRRELAEVGISPGEATAIGTLVSGAWAFRPGWQLNLRLGGQVALRPLTSPMQFTLGSDVGLRGLPGQLISGDSGWLSTGEVAWTFWRNGHNGLQLVPFLGAGGVTTSVNGSTFTDTVGSGGLLARWLNDAGWLVELGWVHQFSTENNPGVWTDWALGKGLYAKVQYRF
jgi:hemolysin activation/secretion protein